jgi:hypothetical protein
MLSADRLGGPRDTIAGVLPAIVPQLVANNGTAALRAAIADPLRYGCEPKVDGVRGLVAYFDGVAQTRNRRGERRDRLRGDDFEPGLRRLAVRLPILWEGTVLDGELTTGRFATTMSALLGSKRHRPDLRLVVFDVPVPRRRRPSVAGLERTMSLPSTSPTAALRGSSSRIGHRPTGMAHGAAGGRSRIRAGTSARRGGSLDVDLTGT